MRFSTDSFQINNDGMDAPVSLKNIGSASHNLGLNVVSPESGNIYDEVSFVTAMAPEFSLSTIALEQILSLASIHTGLCISNTAKTGMHLFGQGHDPCGTNGRVTGANNMQVSIGDGHLLVTGIEASAGSDAVATLRAIALSDGGAAPIAAVYNATLPSTVINNEAFTLGPSKVGGIDLGNDTVRSTNLQSNIEVQVLTDVGSIYPGSVLILKSRPEIRIVTDNPALLASGSIPTAGKACVHGDSFISYIKRKPNSSFEALTSEEHIKITFTGHATINQHFDASGSAVGTCEIVVRCIQPSGSTPLVVATNAKLQTS